MIDYVVISHRVDACYPLIILRLKACVYECNKKGTIGVSFWNLLDSMKL